MVSSSFLSPLQPAKLPQLAATNKPQLPSSLVGSFRNQELGQLTSGIASPRLEAPSAPGMSLSRSASPFQSSDSSGSVAVQSGQRIADDIAASNKRVAQYGLYNQQRKVRAQGVTLGQPGGNTGFIGSVHGMPQQPAKGMVSVGNGQYLARNAARALGQLNQALSAATGHTISVNEGWRGLDRQKQLYALYRAGKGNLAATPGTSIHGTGRAADLGGIGSTNSAQFQWLVKNAYRFGWSWTGRTFSQVEPWHWEYVGN